MGRDLEERAGFRNPSQKWCARESSCFRRESTKSVRIKRCGGSSTSRGALLNELGVVGVPLLYGTNVADYFEAFDARRRHSDWWQ